MVSLFSDDPVMGQYLLILPVAIWEMVIAIWLLVRGFTPGTGGNLARIASADTGGHENREPAQWPA